MSSVKFLDNITGFHVQQAFKLALSLVLFYALALWTNWDVPRYGGLAIIIVSLGTRGASIKQGLMRIAGTTAGVLIGIAVLALVNDDRWGMMVALSLNIVFMTYWMQTSRYRYAWYAAAFIPLTVWADNYPLFDDVFYFTTFRWLQTIVGVSIYTIVDLIFWPRRAGDQLHVAGKELVMSIQQQLYSLRRDESSEVKNLNYLKLTQQVMHAFASFQNARFDTPDVLGNKKAWAHWRIELVRIINAAEMLRECMADSKLRVDQHIPEFERLIDLVDSRLARVTTLWDRWFEVHDIDQIDDSELTKSIEIKLDRTNRRRNEEFQIAILQCAVRQLEILDNASYELLISMQTLCGQHTKTLSQSIIDEYDVFRRPLWDQERFVNALYPAVTFVVAWLVWVMTDPPGGAKVAMLAGLISILVIRTPMNPLALWIGMILSTAFVVAPVYWLIMPALSRGEELLSLIFLLSFFFGCLGAISPAFKSGVLIMFFVSTGISNQQSYSFEGPVNGSLMVLIGGGVVSVIYNLWFPIRPEQTLFRSFQRAIQNLAAYSNTFEWNAKTDEIRLTRIRYHLMQTRILPAIDTMQRAVDSIDYDMIPENTRDQWSRIVDSFQSLSLRLQSFALIYQRTTSQAKMSELDFVASGKLITSEITKILKEWTRIRKQNMGESKIEMLHRTLNDLKRKESNLLEDSHQQTMSTASLADVYALLGSLLLIIRALDETNQCLKKVDCEQLTLTRF